MKNLCCLCKRGSLEKTAEREVAPLVFLDVSMKGQSRYINWDTKEILEGRVEILMPRLSVNIAYNGKGAIRMVPALEEAGALLLPENPTVGEERLYLCRYCKIHSVGEKKKSGARSVSGEFEIPEE